MNMDILEKARREGRTQLSEHESKKVLAAYQVPVAREILVDNLDALSKAAAEIGFPLVLKGCTPELAHKTEKGLIVTDIRNDQEARQAYERLMSGLEQPIPVLVQEMVKGQRELVIGLTRDPQFGPTVMFGLGGIFTEVLHDVSFRVAPLDEKDALEMMNEIRGRKILDAVRGMPAVDLKALSRILIQVGRLGLDHPEIKEIDLNPLIITGDRAVAVDALIILD
jgi:acetyl-CoA synthetase (ADP-forming)